ncbi:NfeD family protein [Actinoplanes sp. DH11]|uniref:NfeD family protein n=1 Tax=Actinoplanes sp. DH11 TaxID=2857011 RepID=UPI001E4DD66F|nr:NfeD family protein [Actinoplanes sp. DH11]
MTTATVVFLVIGGVGLAVLAFALLGGEIGHIGADGLVSLEAVAGFLGALGFAGAITAELLDARAPGSVALSAAIALVAAFVAAALALRFSRAARDMPTDATPARHHLVGTLGVVVTAVPAGSSGYGEVRVRLGGQPVKLNARAEQALPAGTPIFVVEAPTDTSVVVEATPHTGKA